MEDKTSSRCQVERRLVPIKVLNFVFSAATGCLLAFIPVFMEQLGLTSMEIGIIYGCMPFVSFFASPLFGMIADKTRQHKLVMIVSFNVIGLFFNLLLLVPSRYQDKSTETVVQTRMRCGQTGAYFWKYDDVNVANSSYAMEVEKCGLYIDDLIQHNNTEKTDSFKVSCVVSSISDRHFNICTEAINHTLASDDIDNDHALNVSNTNTTIHLSIDLKDISPLPRTYGSFETGLCTRYAITRLKYGSRMFSTLSCPFTSDYDCAISYSNKSSDCLPVKSTLSETFYLCFLFFTVASVVHTSMISMLDSLVYSYLGEEHRADYGKQRMWGTIGFIIAAPISSTIMDLTSSSRTDANFQWSLHIFFGLMLLESIIVYIIPLKGIKTGKFLKNVTKLFRYPEMIVFLAVNMLIGLLSVLYQVFLFLYLKSLNSPQTVLGLALVANCIPETIMLGLSGKLIKKIGCVPCIYLAILALAVRYFSYSLLTNPWYVLFIQPLHAFTFGLMQAAATSYASEMAPKGMSATAQGIRGGFQSGLGRGIGGLLTGKLYDPSGIGAVWTFRVYAIACVVLVVVYAIIQTVFFRNTVKASDTIIEIEAPKDETTKDQEVHDKLMIEEISVENCPVEGEILNENDC